MNVKELKAQAKAAGLKGYSKMTKAELLNLLSTKSKTKKKIIRHDDKPSDKLYFYSKSKDTAPGKGANEIVSAAAYAELAEIDDWRKVLSNFHVCPFKYRGKTYNSIEHVFQAVKIALADKQAALRFTLESDDPIGTGDGAVAQKHRKLVKLTPELLANWGTMKDDVMKQAAIAKYKACPEARRVLLATGDAELWHIVMRSKPVRFKHLEEIRTSMK